MKKRTYHTLFALSTAAISDCKGGGADLSVPRYGSMFRCRAHTQRINAVGVAIAVTIVIVLASIPTGPHKYRAQSSTTLARKEWSRSRYDAKIHNFSE